MKYTAYFDCGTTNTRIYILDEALAPQYHKKSPVGVRSNVISGDRSTLTAAMHELYQEALLALNLSDADVCAIYASGMISSAYGLHEVPHCELPVSLEAFADKLCDFEEERFFRRTIRIIPGLKRLDEDFDYVNNVRGEEMEVIGLMDMISAEYPGRTCAVALPGSHTQIIFVRDGALLGIISNFTGEAFQALASETILGPILTVPFDAPDREWILKGVQNLNTFGFNRAIYIAHAMKTFSEGTPAQRLSYSEGVLFGGVAVSAEHYCERFFPDCRTMLIIADPAIGALYQTIFSTQNRFSVNRICTADAALPYSVQGLQKLLRTLDREKPHS